MTALIITSVVFLLPMLELKVLLVLYNCICHMYCIVIASTTFIVCLVYKLKSFLGLLLMATS